MIPDFGTVALGEVEVGIEPAKSPGEFPRHELEASRSLNESNYFTLKMLNMELGCVGHGTVSAATTTVNGGTRP
jgi:hypothetical protein